MRRDSNPHKLKKSHDFGDRCTTVMPRERLELSRLAAFGFKPKLYANSTTEAKIYMVQVGFEPTYPKGSGFAKFTTQINLTVRRFFHSATAPY